MVIQGHGVSSLNIRRHPGAAAHRCICLLSHHRRATMSAMDAGAISGLPDSDSTDGYVVGYDCQFNDCQIPRPEYACRLWHQPADVRHAYHLPDEPDRGQKLRLDRAPQPAERCLRIVALLADRHRRDGLDRSALLLRLSLRNDVHRPSDVLQSRTQLHRHGVMSPFGRFAQNIKKIYLKSFRLNLFLSFE